VKNFKIKSFCKINLYLRVVKKLNNGYHNIRSLITFCNLHDLILVSKIKDNKDNINFVGDFKKGINRKSNTIVTVLKLLRKNNFLKNQAFKIRVKKNIPHGSGLGGGSADAAALLNYLNLKMNLKLKKSLLYKIANKIGFDVPIYMIKKNTLLTGNKRQLIRLSKKFELSILIVYPNLICSTKKIFKKNKTFTAIKYKSKISIKNKNKLINLLKNEKNDLEKSVVSLHPKVGKIIDFVKKQKGCYFSRITGSGSACIGIFSNMKASILAKKMIKRKFPNYWCVISKTI
jgi:4-diphosphocytidyl-2-C-methyl-D-erythritol kinase